MSLPNSKSKSSKKNHSANIEDKNPLADTTPVHVIGAPPAAGVPRLPSGYVPEPPGAPQKGRRPTRGQVTDAPTAAAEVSASATFSADFSEKIPQATIASRLARAAAWRSELVATKTWSAYVRQEDARAWREALDDLEAFKLAFAYAKKRDPEIVARYPHLARFLGVRKEAGLRAAKTRKAEKARAKAAPATTPTTEPAKPAASDDVVVTPHTNGASNGAAHA